MANGAYRRLVRRDDLVGRGVAEALPEVVGQGFIQLLDTVRQSREPYVGQAVPVFLTSPKDGVQELRHVDFVYQPIQDEAGEVTGIVVQGHDVSEQRRAQRDLQRQTELLSLAQEGGGFGTYDWDLVRGTVRGSRLFREFFDIGDKPEECPVGDLVAHIHPEDHAFVAGLMAGNLAAVEEPHEFRLLLGNRVLWIGARGMIIRNAAGAVERVLGAVYDLTSRKEAERQLDTLARESAHRVKNLLTIIQIVSENTLRRAPSLAAARETLRERISVLNQAQTRILSGPEDCRLKSIIEDAMQIAADGCGSVAVAGSQEVDLTPRTGLGLTLAFHELATNALKYGALSVPDGQIRIDWQVDVPADNGEALVTLEWSESGGPVPVPEARTGFGSMLIRNSLAHDPHGRTDWALAPDGVRCRFVFRATF